MELSAGTYLPPALELEIKGAARDRLVLGNLLAHLREQLATSSHSVPLWFMPGSADGYSVRIGLHASPDEHSDLLARVKAVLNLSSEGDVLTVLPPGASFRESSILKRLPYGLGAPLAARLLESYLIGADMALTLLADRSFPLGTAQELERVFCQLVEQCFDALNLSSHQKQSYSLFHRDSLIRFLVLRAGKGQEKACEVLNLLEERASFVVRSSNRQPGQSSDEVRALRRYATNWLISIVEACSAARVESSLTSLPDPFAKCPDDIILFQLLHMMARQLGLAILEEAEALTIVRGLVNIQEPHSSVHKFVLTCPPLERERTLSPQSSAPIGHRSPWMLLVEAGSDEGGVLIRRFNNELGPAYKSCVEALMVLRTHELGERRIERAAKCLDTVRSQIEGSEVLTLLLGRFFWGSEAYYYYCQGDFLRAENILNRAGKCLNGAIDSEIALVPCAPLNSDIPLQRARVARRLGDWPRVTRELSLLADLESGRQPLQQRTDGLVVTYPLIERMCFSRSKIGEDERQMVREYLDLSGRISRLNRWIRSFYLQRGIIPEW